MSQQSGDSTPFLSPSPSPTQQLTAVMAVTSMLEEETFQDRYDDNVSTVTDVDDEKMMWHAPLKNRSKPETWDSPSYVPSVDDRCGQCVGCRSGSCFNENNKHFETLKKKRLRCVGCDNKKSCVLRGSCSQWNSHMVQNWTTAMRELGETLKKRYTKTQLVKLDGEEGWFVQTVDTTLQPPAYSATSQAPPLFTPHDASGTDSRGTIDASALQDALTGLAGGITQLNSNMTTLSSNFQAVAQKQLEQSQHLDSMQQQLIQQQSQQEEIRRDMLLLQHKPAPVAANNTGNEFCSSVGFSLEGRRACAGTGEGRQFEQKEALADDPINKLAAILEQNLVGAKPTMRYPAFSLPKVIGVHQGRLEAVAYYSWKNKCTALILEHSVPDSLALSLVQAEPTLPPRYRAQIANASTLAGAWTILDSMNCPLESLLPKLIRELTSLESAWGHDEQIATYDALILKLNQIQEFFPHAELDLQQLTACLACFQSPENLSAMPDILNRFRQTHTTTGQSYIQILHDHCQKRRADIYSILTSMALYRAGQTTPHNNISNSRGSMIGGRGSERRNVGETEHWAGGTSETPARCHLCTKSVDHMFFKCDVLKEVRAGTTRLDSKATCLF